MSSHLDPGPEISALNTTWVAWMAFTKGFQQPVEQRMSICQRLKFLSSEHLPEDVEKVLARIPRGST